MSRVRRKTRQTSLRCDAALFGLVSAAGQLMWARRHGRVLDLAEGRALVIVDGDLSPGASSGGSWIRLVAIVAAATLVAWVLPIFGLAVLVGAVDRLLQVFGAPPGVGVVYAVLVLLLWVLVLVVRAMIFVLFSRISPGERAAALVVSVAPTVVLAVSRDRCEDDGWLARQLPTAAARSGVALTVLLPRLVGGDSLESAFDGQPGWTRVDPPASKPVRLFLTNPTDRRVATEDLTREVRRRSLALAPRVGALAVGAFLIAGLILGYLVWRADTESGTCVAPACTPIGTLGDSLYWGLAMITGFGGAIPRTVPARLCAVILEIASLVLTAALVGTVLSALETWAKTQSEEEMVGDLAAWERAGLLGEPMKAIRPGLLTRVVRRLRRGARTGTPRSAPDVSAATRSAVRAAGGARGRGRPRDDG